MKILMDGRNRGAGENGKCYGVNIEQPCSLKFLSQTKKLTNKFIKLVLAIFFIVATTGFKYIDKLDDNISRSFVANDITQIDTLELNPHTNIKKQEYESTIKEFRDFMLENQILFDDISREEFKYECNKLIQNSKDRSILDTNLDLQKIMAKLNQGHVQILSYFENSYSNLIVSKFRDGYYIMGSLHDDIIGSKIIAINGHDIEDVMKSIAKYSSAENKSFKENRASQYVMMMNILKRENIINNAKINLTLEKENKKYKRTIEPTTFDKIVLNGFKIGYSEKLYMFYLSDFYENNLGDKFKQLSPIQYFKGNNELYYNELKRNSLIVHYNSAIEYNDGNIYKFIEDFDQKIKKI